MTSPALSAPSTFGLVVRWTRVTFYGWFVGIALILVFVALSGLIGLADSQFPIGLGMGVGVGLLQRRVIAERTGSAAGWLGASALGLTAPFLARDVARLLTFQLPYALTGSVVIGGLIVSLLQWRVLRLDAGRAASWVAASVLGWTLGGSTSLVDYRVIARSFGVLGVFVVIGVYVAGGILLGATTGLVLPWTLKARLPAQHGA